MKDHCHDDEKHTKTNCHDKHGIQLPEEGQRGHVVDGAYPQCGDHVFKTEDTSEEESEYCGKSDR